MVLVLFHDPDLRRCLGPPKASFWILVSHYIHLWIEFGTGKDRRWLPIHDYANALEERVCSGLLFWYAFTGCDTASSFCGRGKLTAWDVWKAFPEVTETFVSLSNAPDTVTNEHMSLLQR